MPGFDSLEPGVDPLYPATQCTRSSLGYSDTLLGYLARLPIIENTLIHCFFLNQIAFLGRPGIASSVQSN